MRSIQSRSGIAGGGGATLLLLAALQPLSAEQPEGLPPLSADPAVFGREIAMQCVACHGPEGATDNPTFPMLAGQHAAYLAEQLHHFRSGKRYSSIMSPIAETLSDEEIAAVAIYFSEQTDDAREDRETRKRSHP